MEAFSPCRRRASPSQRVDSTPMLMSARSELESSDIIAPGGRIMLTPTRAVSDRYIDEGIYQEMATPLNDTSQSLPVRTHAQARVMSKGLSEPLIMGASSARQLHTSHSYRSVARSSTVQHRSGLSKRAVRIWHFVANTVMALCLLAAVILRVNAISVVYLLVLCYGILKSFASGPLVVFVIVVSTLACIGHILYATLLQSNAPGWNGEHALEIIGFTDLSDTASIVTHAGLDALVLFCSVIHYFVVLRRLQLPAQEEAFDLFEAGAQLLQQDGEETRRSRRLATMLHSMELLCVSLLFLTAFSVPAGATAVFYLALLSLLISSTVYTKRISVDDFVNSNSQNEFLIGPTVAKMLLAWCVVTIVAWYTLLFADIASSSLGRDIIKYAGFADFRSTSPSWEYYVFAALVSLLFVAVAKLVNVHHSFKKMVANNQAHFDGTSGLYHLEASQPPKAGVGSGLQPALPPQRVHSPQEVAKLLQELPFRTRVFLRDGGSLVASAAAIAWCVSYPSYGSAPMMGWALITLGLYGVVPSGSLVKLLILYATALSLTEYAVNLTWDFVAGDYTKYGLKQFDYPFLDLGVHNFCLVVIYASMRTRWRYEDVVNASKAEVPQTPEGGSTQEVDRTSMDAFRQLVAVRKTADTSWNKFLPLWIQDAKQVVLTHLGVLVLLTIVAVALSTRESLFQAGYLVLAMLCIVFFKHRQKLWRVLLIYALAVCFASFIRNVDCKQNDRFDLIGLVCYSEDSDTWGSLWPTLYSAQLIIILQLVFQLVIYVAAAQTIDERMRNIEMSHQNPVFFTSRVAVEIDNIFRVIGGPVCYVAILAIVFKLELLDAGTHTTLLGAVQLVVLLIVIGGHLGKFKRAPRSSLRLKILWSFAMIVEVIILITRYIYHFKDVSNYLEKHLFTSSFMSARDFGLEKQSTKNSLSGVFIYLAPTAVLIGLMFWQLSSIMQDVRAYDVFVAGRNRFVDQVLFWMETTRRVLIAFSTTSLILVTMSVAISHVNAVGAAYVLVLVVGRPLSSWQKLWFPLFWVSAISIATTYVYQMRLFGSIESAGDVYHRVDLGDNAKWFGLNRLLEDGSTTRSSMWELNWGPLLVLLMCFVQRMAQYFEMSAKAVSGNIAQTRRPPSHVSSTGAQNSGALSPGQVGSPASDAMNSTSAGTPEASQEGSMKLQSFLAQQSDSDDDEADFFSLMRDFCIEYAGSASVNVVMLLLTASAFVHRDVISIAYLIVVYGMMYARPENVCKLWFILASALSLIILAEYTLIVWLPPLAGVDKEDIPPWKSLSASEERWLALNNQHKWALLADFIALLGAYMLPNSQRLRPNDHTVEVRVQATLLNKRSAQLSMYRDEEGSLSSSAIKELAIVESEFMRKTKQSAWHALVYFFILGWLPVTLLVIFICGAKHGGIASFVYIGSAVFMLYRLDDARLPDSKWIHQLRKFNWIHLFVMVIISAPYVNDELSRCLVGTNANSGSTAGDACLSVEGLLGVQTEDVPTGIIAIFVLISIQCEMLSTPTYREVCQYIQIEKLQAPARQAEIFRKFYRDRTAQWFSMKKEKGAALQRLRMIVSKLVHKVEELMDIAMGLHFNLPPMAPSKPRVVEYFQNAVTLEWDPPQETLHKIRFFRITRQQYPSQTLLGDFGDVIEVKGDTTSLKIEGLRPGSSYQFKVAAVSRMGEGPFSAASDPASTYPLNLDGSCTAGWMKYRRENVRSTWTSVWLSWIQPKFLHRYVVLDPQSLVFYKDEELALRHRSKRRRKKIKTSFVWKDVVTLRLSENKVQFDDVSPMLFCFELIVRQDGNDADIKYVFQVEIAKDFDRFLSALAFAVPLYMIDESILQYLHEKQLPVPQATQVDDNDNGDETGSEMSSVTGDESSFGDAEDAEFDDKAPASWYIPVYRFLYSFQDAAMQAETTVYDADDQVEPTLAEILGVAINAIRSRTAQWCYIVMIIAFARQADVLNFVYVLCTFGYLGIESPRPSSHSWLLLLKYTCVTILVRYAFQLPVFCQGLSPSGFYYPSFQPFCGAPKNSVVLQERAIQPSVVFGIFKFDGVTLPGVDDIFQGLQWNFYVAIAILWHRRELIIRGLWVDSSEQRSDDGRASSEYGSRRNLNGSQVSSRDSIDESFNFGGGGVARFLNKPDAKSDTQPNSTSAPNSPSALLAEMDPEQANSQLEKELAEQILQELETEEEEQQLRDQELEAAEQDLQRRRTSEPPNSTATTINMVTEQIEMEDTSETTPGAFAKQKRSWFETRFPQVHTFFKKVVCAPPVHWDKDIHAAVAGAKPGRDFFAPSLAIMLFAAVFAVIFFKPIGDPDASSATGAAAQVKSTSTVSGYLVLVVFIQLCFIIWDRAAYVCGSLTSKIVLQYSYIVLLHFCLWVLMPQHIGVYFQQRAALVIFYLLHCVYLWLGALQIRYGYPVFRGSRYNYTTTTTYQSLKEKVFPLVMLAPFLFEMRALLDYVCTKTSLSWQHWVLLEDTAAHLFHVKMEMRGRVEDATVLQGKTRQPLQRKLMSAGVMLLFLLFCLIGPLLLFSSANPSTTPNRIKSTDVVLGIEDSRGTVNRLYAGVDINSPDYEGDQIADSAAVQRVTYDTFSREVWASSPPNVARLVSQLESAEKLSWVLTISFVRPGPTDHQTIETTHRVNLTAADRIALVPLIQLNSSNTTVEQGQKDGTPIRIESIMPSVVELTATSGVYILSSQLRSVNITKHTSAQGSSWWSVEPLLRRNVTGSNANDREFCDELAPFCLIAVSDNIVQGLSALGIGSYGITAVYIFVLVTVGSAVKGFFRGALFQIQYSELPDPDDVLELVEGIYIARSERYVGHLKDEVRIFETLIRVLRSPETLSKVTGTNVIHIPKAKEKAD